MQRSIGIWSWVISRNVCQGQDSKQRHPGSSLLPESGTSFSRDAGCHTKSSPLIKDGWDYHEQQFLFGKYRNTWFSYGQTLVA